MGCQEESYIDYEIVSPEAKGMVVLPLPDCFAAVLLLELGVDPRVLLDVE